MLEKENINESTTITIDLETWISTPLTNHWSEHH